MAEKTQDAKEISVEQKLKALYDLQTIVSEIDKIKILRGELPGEVQDLEDEIIGLQTRLKNIETEITNINAEIAKRNQNIVDSNALNARYKEQMDNVRNNREYDHLTKEIEFQSLEIELAQKNIRDYSVAIERKHEELEKSKYLLEDKTNYWGVQNIERVPSKFNSRGMDIFIFNIFSVYW